MKNLFIGLLITGSTCSYASSELPDELMNLNGDYSLVSGHERCDQEISIFGYDSLSVNIEVFRDIYFNEINEGRSSGRCMDGIGSKVVYETTFKDGLLTNYVSKKRVGCFRPKAFVKLEKESELKILDKNSFELSMIMRADEPVVCTYKRMQ